MQDGDDIEQVEICPICYAYIPVQELQQHVELHIASQPSEEHPHDPPSHLHCDECSTNVPLDEWDSHCLAHRWVVHTCTCEVLTTLTLRLSVHSTAEDAAALDEQQRLNRLQEHYLAAMQAQQGFTTKV